MDGTTTSPDLTDDDNDDDGDDDFWHLQHTVWQAHLIKYSVTYSDSERLGLLPLFGRSA